MAAVKCVICFVLLAVCLCDGLDKGEPGVCGISETITKKVIKSVRRQYSCNRRLCYKTVRIPVIQREKVISYICCEGWQYVESEGACRPLCRLGCKNGTCTAPDTCQCQPPLILKDNSCVQPICDPACFNGHCTNDNTCSCHDNLVPHNSTHCAPVCNTGYAVDEQSLQCIAKCDKACVNSTCVAPDTCECSTGHVKSFGQDNVCVPNCEPACVNSKCTAPNVCTCDKDHVPDEIWSCKPKCDECDNGVCTSPNQCQCSQGYTKQDGKCTPVCDKACSNGFCTGPNVCTCDKGYTSDNVDKFKCDPVCDPVCVNASCVSPDKCACDAGYEVENEWSCKPICKACNGDCVAPGQCKCFEGYTLANATCVPLCPSDCVNGFCSAPGVCSCNEGFQRNESNPVVCFRDCKESCGMGVCSDVGICVCNAGFEFLNDTCASMTPVECSSCNVSCAAGACRCPDARPCYALAGSEEVTSTPRMAGLELTFLVGGVLGLLLLLLLVIVIQRTWRRRQDENQKTPEVIDPLCSSVTYIVPDALLSRSRAAGAYAHELEPTEARHLRPPSEHSEDYL